MADTVRISWESEQVVVSYNSLRIVSKSIMLGFSLLGVFLLLLFFGGDLAVSVLIRIIF